MINSKDQDNILENNTFASYAEEDLLKLYRTLKGRMTNPLQYKSKNYRKTIWEISKNIEKTLEAKREHKIKAIF